MKATIYYSFHRDPLPKSIFQSLLFQLPYYLREKVKKFVRWQDAHSSLFGKHLLLNAMRDNNLGGDLGNLNYTSFGKPFLKDEKFYFNISHSSSLTLCIVSLDSPVGIDAEERIPMDFLTFKDIFSIYEWRDIIVADFPLLKFYDFWTRKEAVLKGEGTGLVDDMKRIEVRNDDVTFSGNNWHLKCVNDLNDLYSCHIATKEKLESLESIEIDFGS